jgi:predicted nuclease of predicted toxin-antitoxin system
VKLLLDENLSRRIVPFIQDLYPNSTQVALAGLEQSDDKIIRQYAIDNDFVIVTKDADYYDMTVLYGQPPKIIWLKIGNQSKAATIKTLQDNQQAIEKALIMNDKACIEIL